MQRIAMTVMLKDKPGIIEEYDRIHADPYPVVLEKGHQAGIRRLFIYRLRRQLFMFIETDDGFDIETSMAEALTDPEFMEWDTLTWEMQEAQVIPSTGSTIFFRVLVDIFLVLLSTAVTCCSGCRAPEALPQPGPRARP